MADVIVNVNDNLQAAVNRAVAGDRILIAPGKYEWPQAVSSSD